MAKKQKIPCRVSYIITSYRKKQGYGLPLYCVNHNPAIITIHNIRCRVCGKLFEPCAYCKSHSDVFRWRNFACSRECAAKYIKETTEYRESLRNTKKNTEQNKDSVDNTSKDKALTERRKFESLCSWVRSTLDIKRTAEICPVNNKLPMKKIITSVFTNYGWF